MDWLRALQERPAEPLCHSSWRSKRIGSSLFYLQVSDSLRSAMATQPHNRYSFTALGSGLPRAQLISQQLQDADGSLDRGVSRRNGDHYGATYERFQTGVSGNNSRRRGDSSWNSMNLPPWTDVLWDRRQNPPGDEGITCSGRDANGAKRDAAAEMAEST